MAREHKRRKYLISMGYQGRMILASLIFAAGGCLLFMVMFGFFFADVLNISYLENGIRLEKSPQALLLMICKENWLMITLAAAVLVLLSIRLSHRIAGPMYRFERTLELMQQGYLDQVIVLREKDEGKVLADRINGFNEQLSRSLARVSRNVEAIDTLMARISELAPLPENEEELAGLRWSLLEHNRKIGSVCCSYRLRQE